MKQSANVLTISEGASVVLGSGNINTTDPDNTPAQLNYTAIRVSGGQLELVSAPGLPVLSFTQAQINSRAGNGSTGTQHFRNKYCRVAQKQPFNSRLLLLRSLQRQSAVSPSSALSGRGIGIAALQENRR